MSSAESARRGLARLVILTVVGLSFVLISAQSAAAFEKTGYPPDWPPLMFAEDGGCPSLTGVYQYYGEESSVDVSQPGLGPPRLEANVFRRPPVRGKPETVSIEHDQIKGTAELRIEGENLSPDDRVSFIAKLPCEEGWLVQRNEFDGSLDGTPMQGANLTAIGRGKDGSLIAYYQHKTKIRHLFLFSETQKGKGWYRFLPVKTDKVDNPPLDGAR